MIVDAHAHLWKAVESTADTIVNSRCDIPASLLRTYLDEHGVDRAVLVQPMYPGEDNSLILDVARAEPERFAAVVVAHSPESLARCAGARGLRVRPSFGEIGSDALWEAARGLVVSVLGRPEHVKDVARKAERFPDIPIVLDHFLHGEAVLELARFPNTYLKVSGTHHFAFTEALLKEAVGRFGPDRLLWGSDFPHVLLRGGYAAARRLADRLPEAARGATARRLYWS
jgi:L-fuconolactonase